MKRGVGVAGVPFALAVGVNLWTDVRLALGHSYLAVVAWLASLGWMIAATAPPPIDPERPSSSVARRLGRMALVCLPALVRVADYRLDRIHGDDLLTAYFSNAYDLRRTDFFVPVPPDPTAWVAQFPAPYFVLQKLFFVAFGPTLLTIKLSILPYVIVVSALLYALVRELLDERGAVLAVIVYAFFGPALYLETLGLHFVSSTAAFLTFLLFALRERRGGAACHALFAGIAAGACYLFYVSSFLALPFAALFFWLRGSAERERTVARNGLLFVAGVVAVLGPFACDASLRPDSYFGRVEQVSLIGGQWSNARERIARGENPAHIVAMNLRQSIRALYEARIGGHGGYDFGHQALLEPLSLLLATLGILRAIALARTNADWWLVLLVIAAAFVAGMGLTIPPPAFHRFAIAFPFLALLVALPLHAILSLPVGTAWSRHAVAAIVLVGFALTQQLYFLRAALPENEFPALRLASFLNRRFPERPIYVAAFPSFAFEKIYFFAPDRPVRRVKSDYHASLLATLNPREKYAYVITLPNKFDETFARRDPKGRFIHFSEEYSLFVN